MFLTLFLFSFFLKVLSSGESAIVVTGVYTFCCTS